MGFDKSRPLPEGFGDHILADLNRKGPNPDTADTHGTNVPVAGFDKSRPFPDGFGDDVLAELNERGPRPDLITTLGASVRTQSWLGSYIAAEKRRTSDFFYKEPGYSVYADGGIEGYEDYRDRFDFVFNKKAELAIKTDIDRESADDKIRAVSQWTSLTDLVGGNLDFTSLVPAGKAVQGGSFLYNLALNSAKGAGREALLATAQESLLYATRETQDLGNTQDLLDSAGNILGAGLSGAVVEGGKAVFGGGGKKPPDIIHQLEEDFADGTPHPAQLTEELVRRKRFADPAELNSGSMLSEMQKTNGFENIGGRATLAQETARTAVEENPGLALMTSQSPNARAVFNGLVETTVKAGVGAVVSSAMPDGKVPGSVTDAAIARYQDSILPKVLRQLEDHWRSAREDGWVGSHSDFYSAIARAAERGDVDPAGNPHVEAAAKALRSDLLNPLKDEAIDAGVLPRHFKNVPTPGALYRIWDRRKVMGNEERFRTTILGWLREQMTATAARQRDREISEKISRATDPTQAKASNSGGSTALNPLPTNQHAETDLDRAAAETAYLYEIVDRIYDRIVGRSLDAEFPAWMVPAAGGPLESAVLDIPDALAGDFVETDVVSRAVQYVRTMAADVDLARIFGRADLKDQIAAVRADYGRLRTKAGTERERQRLRSLEVHDIRHIGAFRDMVRGAYRVAQERMDWAAFNRAAGGWSYLARHGGVVFTSLPPLLERMTLTGLRSYMQEELPIIGNELKGLRIARRDARALGTVIDVLLRTRLAEFAGLQDPFASGAVADRTLGNVREGFSNSKFVDQWDDMNVSIVSVMTAHKVARLLLSGPGDGPALRGSSGMPVSFARLSRHERRYLEKLNIDEAMGARIAEQIRTYGHQEKGIQDLNIRAWDDDGARQAIAVALFSQIEGAARQSQASLWERSNAGKLLKLFTGLSRASNRRILKSRLKELPEHLAEYMLFGTLFGMLAAYLNTIAEGNFDDAGRLLSDPDRWIKTGFDRTGIAPVLMDVSDTGEALGLPLGFRPAAHGQVGNDNNIDPLLHERPDGSTARLGPVIRLLQGATQIAAGAR